MKIAAILCVTLGLGVAGSAVAASHLTDMDYLKANRCRGLAEGLGVGDTASLDSLIKTEGRSRIEVIYQRGLEEMQRGKRDGAKTDGKERYAAELNGACSAFLGGGKETAAAR